MRVNLMQHKMSDNPPVPELEKIKTEAAQCVDVLRDTIWAIEQDVFEMKDFIERIDAYAKRILPEDIHYNVENEVSNPFELDSFTALNLFRIIQEALQNVMKHSKADTVNICFSATPALVVSISDNGLGSKHLKNDNTSHYGLNNMRERVKDMGAKLQIYSTDNKGFRLVIAFQR